MKRINFVFILLAFFVISIVSAVPPVTTVSNLERGVDIVHPETQFLKQGNNLEVNFWTYNSTSGETLTNSSLNCTMYFINSSGYNFLRLSNQAGAGGLITYGKGATLCVDCWTSIVRAGNFSLGEYSYQIKCQGPAKIAGYYVGFFEVTATGEDIDTPQAMIYIALLVISLIMFFGLIVMGIALPSGNKRDEMTGYILAVSNLKYLKYLFLGFSYVFAVFISYLVWMLSYAYLDFGFLTSIFQFIFYALAITTLPLFVLYVYLVIANLVRDNKIGDYLMRGLKIR